MTFLLAFVFPLHLSILSTSKFVNSTNKRWKLFTAREYTTPTLYNLQTKSAFPSSMEIVVLGLARASSLFLPFCAVRAKMLLCRHTNLTQGRLDVLCSATLDFNDIGAVQCNDILQGVSPDCVDSVCGNVEVALQDYGPVETP